MRSYIFILGLLGLMLAHLRVHGPHFLQRQRDVSLFCCCCCFFFCRFMSFSFFLHFLCRAYFDPQCAYSPPETWCIAARKTRNSQEYCELFAGEDCETTFAQGIFCCFCFGVLHTNSWLLVILARRPPMHVQSDFLSNFASSD